MDKFTRYQSLYNAYLYSVSYNRRKFLKIRKFIFGLIFLNGLMMLYSGSFGMHGIFLLTLFLNGSMMLINNVIKEPGINELKNCSISELEKRV